MTPSNQAANNSVYCLVRAIRRLSGMISEVQEAEDLEAIEMGITSICTCALAQLSPEKTKPQ